MGDQGGDKMRACGCLRAVQNVRGSIVRSSPWVNRVVAPSQRMYAIKVDSSSHSDFAPQSNAKPADSIMERIQQDFDSDDIVVYMKGIPQAPQCGFSNAVIRVLEAEGVTDFAAYNVLEDPELRQGVKDFSDWPTVPQVYIKGEFVGGCDIMIQMHKDGDLYSPLKEAGVKTE